MSLILCAVHGLVLEGLINNKEVEDVLSYKKVGYYIGSFDPLHLGHEAVVAGVLNEELCDYVLIYPAWGGDAYKNRTPVNVRLEMLFATFESHPQVIVTRFTPAELQDALMETSGLLVERKPSVKTKIPGVEYIGIVGSDTVVDSYEDPKKLSVFMRGIVIEGRYKNHTAGGVIAIPVSSFIVGLRDGASIDSFGDSFSGRPIITVMHVDCANLSSTKVREAVELGESINGLVNQKVAKIIEENQLYQDVAKH